MKTAFTLVAGSLATVLVSGCANRATGTWRLSSLEPRQAEQQFDVQTLRLASDGHYDMDAVREGQPVHMSGKYDYDRSDRRITFRDDSGTVETYGARVVGDEMRVWNSPCGNEQFTAVLVRAGNRVASDNPCGCWHHGQARTEYRQAGSTYREKERDDCGEKMKTKNSSHLWLKDRDNDNDRGRLLQRKTDTDRDRDNDRQIRTERDRDIDRDYQRSSEPGTNVPPPPPPPPAAPPVPPAPGM